MNKEESLLFLNNNQEIQKDITRLCIKCALILLQYGAETTLAENLSSRLGYSLGVDEVNCAISANAIVLTTISNNNCLTSTRKVVDSGINMHVITQVHHIVLLAEKNIIDIKGISNRLNNIKPFHYPFWIVIFMVAISCGCFSKLNGGGWDGFLVSSIAGGLAIFVKQMLIKKEINPFIIFCITAFVATSVSGNILKTNYFQTTNNIAMAASVLLLVPGFPLINAVADMFKGHINTGIARWTMASLLTLSTCLGIVLAIYFWSLKDWT